MNKRIIAAVVLAGGVFGTGYLAGSMSGVTGGFAASSRPHQTQATCPNGHHFGMGGAFAGQRPTTAGTVQKVDGSTIELSTRNGTTQTITVNSSTKYITAGGTASLSDIHTGEHIAVVGATSGSNAVTATEIALLPDRAAGKVTNVSGSTYTISPSAGWHGETSSVTTIVTNGSTVFREPGQGAATADAVKVGSQIMAIGTLSSDGKTLTARRVMVLPAGMTAPFNGHMMRGSFGDHMWQGQDRDGSDGMPMMGTSTGNGQNA